MQSTNIENIELWTPLTFGVEEWYKKWCELYCEKGFKIVEKDSDYRCWNLWIENKINFDVDKVFEEKANSLQYLFTYWGGSYSLIDRDLLYLNMLNFDDHALIDYQGKVKDLKKVLDYAEETSYFVDQPFVENIENNFYKKTKPVNQRINQNVDYAFNELFDCKGIQWHCDKLALGSVIRETINTEPYIHSTEKTWRCFYHLCIPFPISYRSVEHLQKLGFQFPHDVIDYSYCDIPLFKDRIIELNRVLTDVLQKSKQHGYSKIYKQCKPSIVHNYKQLDKIKPDSITFAGKIWKYDKQR
jgi:hypothetical protein